MRMIIAQKQREGIMSDSIDRQAAIDLVEDIETRRLKGEVGLIYAPLIKGLRALPSAQPERIRGRWVKDEEASNQHVEPIYICSACNNMDAWGEVEKNTFKFCPNCGADMRGDE